jgi:hypothetical protein
MKPHQLFFHSVHPLLAVPGFKLTGLYFVQEILHFEVKDILKFLQLLFSQM